MLERRGAGLVMTMTIGIVVAPASGCSKEEAKPPQQPPTYYAPRFPAESILTVSFDRIREYADKLHFDTTLGAADELLVDFKRGQIGTERAQRLRIEPESASYRLVERELSQGRIIARIYSDAEVPHVGLGPQWTWWWVDKNGPGGNWRSVFVAESPKPGSRVALRDTLKLTGHGYGYWRQAIARFWVVRVGSPRGDPIWVESWGTCGSCCRMRLALLAPGP